MELNTLAISFYFPPFNRVGGRRWAKHLKYFKQQGQKFHVLAGEYEGRSPWDKDIESYKENISRVPIKINYPYYKKTLPKNIFQKIYWKLSLNYWHYLEKKSKGIFWDDSNESVKGFLTKAEQIINDKKINHVLLSVGPFHYSSILIDLRKAFPDLKITIDYRDYWEDEFHNLSEKQKKYETELQKKVLNSVDAVLAPNEEITSHFMKVQGKKIVYTLPHCFDPSDINVTDSGVERNTDTLNFLYGGALYNKMGNYIELYCRFISLLDNRSIKNKTSIFTSQPGYEEILNSGKVHFTMSKYLGVSDYFSQIKLSDFVLIFRPDWSPNAFSSKYYELLAFRKPILYFGPEGDVSRHLEEHKLGFHFNSQNFEQKFKLFLENLETKNIPDRNYDLKQHTFEFQTKELINYLETTFATNAKAAVLS